MSLNILVERWAVTEILEMQAEMAVIHEKPFAQVLDISLGIPKISA